MLGIGRDNISNIVLVLEYLEEVRVINDIA